MFDLHGIDRLNEWKKFRDQLEKSQYPFLDTLEFWSKAPFVSPYLDPRDSRAWPDPWHLVLEGRLDDLAISLGMLYTLKLTQRFMHTNFEIHMSISDGIKNPDYFLVVDNDIVLDHKRKEILDLKCLCDKFPSKLFESTKPL